MLQLRETPLTGCYEVQAAVYPDARGRFQMMFQDDVFAAAGLPVRYWGWACSVSAPRVLRGLHFQLPPHDQAKLVFVLHGRVLDAVVDLRSDSPTFGRSALFELTAEAARGLYIPRGFAHGFYVCDQPATFSYFIERPYAPAHDAGIRWDSAGIDWPDPDPILSDRDRKLPSFDAFTSPFRLPPGAQNG